MKQPFLEYLVLDKSISTFANVMLERVGKTFIVGDEDCKAAEIMLEKSVKEFHSALLHFGQDVNYQILAQVRGTSLFVSP